jgi:2-oxoisovalerate dehydrogenase E2 component (dihydrolipoyl transacylase)
VGDVLAVGSPLIRIDTSAGGNGHGAAPATQAAPAAAEAAPPAESPGRSVEPLPPPAEPAPIATTTPTNGKVAPAAAPAAGATAAPAVRQRARTLGIDLGTVTGSGPDGRVLHGDLDAHVSRQAPPAQSRARQPVGTEDVVDEVKVIGLRRNIAQRMQLSKTRIPHFTYVEEVDVTEVERLRAHLNQERLEGESRLTVLPLLMRAVVVAIDDFPQMNARYDDENGVVQRHRSVHLGIATQTAKGLMVPVVKDAQSLDMWSFAEELARLSTAARNGKITLEELSGSTITISSLGSLGGIVSTPIINYPEVAIIGVNKITTRPVYVNDVVLPRQIMNLSSSFDHRVVDGADAAAFIQRIRALLETPALLFMP